MGAWGIGNFENDDALDFVYEVEESGDVAVQNALRQVLSDATADAPDACMALAAAELIAIKLGNPPGDRPDSLQAALDRMTATPKELAGRAVDQIASNSELKDLWAETDEFDAWLALQTDLKKRLL